MPVHPDMPSPCGQRDLPYDRARRALRSNRDRAPRVVSSGSALDWRGPAKGIKEDTPARRSQSRLRSRVVHIDSSRQKKDKPSDEDFNGMAKSGPDELTDGVAIIGDVASVALPVAISGTAITIQSLDEGTSPVAGRLLTSEERPPDEPMSEATLVGDVADVALPAVVSSTAMAIQSLDEGTSPVAGRSSTSEERQPDDSVAPPSRVGSLRPSETPDVGVTAKERRRVPEGRKASAEGEGVSTKGPLLVDDWGPRRRLEIARERVIKRYGGH